MASSGTIITTAAATLSSFWVRPSDPACLRTTGYWIWSWAPSSDARTVLGGPSQTSSCLPLGWDSARTYAGTACPPQYTPGCPETGDGVVTCCPTAHPFTCRQNLKTSDHGEWFRCIMQYRQPDSKSITIADMNAYTTRTEVRTHGTNAHLHALAVLYQTPFIDRTKWPFNDNERRDRDRDRRRASSGSVGSNTSILDVLAAEEKGSSAREARGDRYCY
ncbi:hypothetical protein PG993_003837 [Apiospora rasikravindrae]|uniref:Uncharacterized protein n=1 Tax=Apiospora rasikravindrae TaxID=990691 RepID=A0ABR1U0M9_9PEZI